MMVEKSKGARRRLVGVGGGRGEGGGGVGVDLRVTMAQLPGLSGAGRARSKALREA
jgi:hypothetical protein